MFYYMLLKLIINYCYLNIHYLAFWYSKDTISYSFNKYSLITRVQCIWKKNANGFINGLSIYIF